MSSRLLPGMSRYLKDFETERRNPHQIKVKLFFRKSGLTVEGPLRLTTQGNLSSADKERYLSPPAKEANSGTSAVGPSV
jgi:hypothetical protein